MIDFLSRINAMSKGGSLMKQVFKYCLNNGKSTIPEIAKGLNYSVPAITKHVAELCEEGFFTDFGKTEAKEGRPANIYGVNQNSCYFVGVDIRWFSLSIGIINLSGEILKISTDNNFVFENNEQTLNNICRRVKEFINNVQAENIASAKKILNINVNISGRVNPKTGYSFSIFNHGEVPLSTIIANKLGYNVTIDNDTRAMAFGEYSLQSADNRHSTMIFVNIGWGIGIGIIIDGVMFEGKSGYSGEFGHMSVFDNEILCHCGKKGCLETEASGLALHRDIVQQINSGSQSVLAGKVRGGQEITIYEIIDAIVRKEDILCIETLEAIGMKMGKQIANLINIFNPDTVVIGGLIAQTGDYILQPIKMAVHKYALTLVSKDTEVVLSKLKSRAGVVGACMMARHRVLEE